MNETDSNLAIVNKIGMKQLFSGRKVAMFGVPAPFTGTCTTAHYPPYQKIQDEMSGEVDEIVCYTVADPYAHYNWGRSMGNDFDKISFVADVDCEWAKLHNLQRDYAASSLGTRSCRFSMIVDNGVVTHFNFVDDHPENDAEALLRQLKE